MTATKCCGKYNEQYCCTIQEKDMQSSMYNGKDTEYESTYNQKPDKKDSKIMLLIICVPLIFVALILLAVLIFVCHKKKLYEKVPLRSN